MMMNEEYGEPRANVSSPSLSNSITGHTGSSFDLENEGLANETGEAVMFDMVPSITDITLDKALLKMKEIDKENILLKENLIENNQQIQRQYETLKMIKTKDKEKVDRFKALISSLREEVTESQIKLMAQNDKERDFEKKLARLESENAHLLRQKTLCEQRVVNVVTHAELQGVIGLDDLEDLPDFPNAVFVSTQNKEKEIESLEAKLAMKDETITDLRNDVLMVKHQRDQYKMSNEIILKDMEGLQKQKEQLDSERRHLHEQTSQLSRELDQQMQSNIASTKKEIEVQRNVAEAKPLDSDTSGFLDDVENLEEMFDKKVVLEQQQDSDKLKEDLRMEKSYNIELEEKLQQLTSDLTVLKSQFSLAQEKIEILETEKLNLRDKFEEDLTSIAHQRQENKNQEAKVSEDQNVLRSQVVSLLTEVDELNSRLSAATMVIQQKDQRINEISNMNSNWKDKCEEQWHQSTMMIQTLQEQLIKQQSLAKQHREEHNGTKQQYQSLQDNFNRLVNDYKDILEMFESERSNQQGASKENMEEMNNLAAQLIAAEETIDYREKQIEEFKAKCSSMKVNNEMLHYQLEVYTTDFKAESLSKRKIEEEKNTMAEELRKAHDQIRVLAEQRNQRQMEDIQRRVNVNHQQRPPSYEEMPKHYQDSTPPIHHMQQQGLYQEMPSGTANQQNNLYRLQNPGGHTYEQPVNAAAAQFDDQNVDQFPSLSHQCPKCNRMLPDYDSLALHVADCLDRQS